MVFLYLVIFASFILTFLYHYSTRNYNYWKNQGIPSPEKCLPFIGNMRKVTLIQESLVTLGEELYKKGSNQSMIGFYLMTTPTLLIRDPELVKKVLVTDFSSFRNNLVELHEELDSLLITNPFFSKDDAWKESRISLAKFFSLSKLKFMFSLLCEVSLKFDQYLDNEIRKGNGVAELELKSLFHKYSGELVATAGMGVEGKCFEETPETFGKIISSLFQNPTFAGDYVHIIVSYLPRLAKFLKLGLISKEMNAIFRKSVKEIVKRKKQEGGGRNDFLQFAMESKKSNEVGKELDLANHVISFILDAQETTKSSLHPLTFHLASNPDVQVKLRNEINSVFLKYNGKWEYEALKDLVYMEQVINESLRLNPPVGIMMKVCTKETQLVGSDGLSCRVLPGNIVGFSLYGLHKDPKYWTDPEKFQPERFNEDRKKDINKLMFLPFSEGPRKCLGMRLGQMFIKMAIIAIFQNYSLEVSPKTRIPLKQDPRSNFLTAMEGGLWAVVKPFSKNS